MRNLNRGKLLCLLALLFVALSAPAFAVEVAPVPTPGGGGGGPAAPAELPRVTVEGSVTREPVVDLPRVTVEGEVVRPDYGFEAFRTNNQGPYPSGPGLGSSKGQPRQAAVPAYNNEKANCSNPKSSGPVILSSGEKYLEEGDFSAGGLHGLGLVRRYHSKGTTYGMFGPKWVGTYDYANLAFSGCIRNMAHPDICFPQTIKFTDAEGASYTYSRGTNGNYKVRGSVSAGSMSYDPENEQIYLIKGTQSYIYGLNGRLLYLALNGSSFIGFNYDGPYGLLSSVTSSGGQSVQFNWSGGRLSSIVDPGGNVWNYGYAASGMLSSVTAPGSNADIRSYYYENPTDGTLVTGIGINGNRFSTYSYDASKRVSQSIHTDGELADSFSYSTNQTSVTDALGQTTTYTFTPVQGALQITGVSRSATSTCPAAAASTVYDGNGWVDYSVDWNGNRTDYNYDAAGRLLQVTTAAGTASQLTTTHQWSGDKITGTNYLNSAGASYLRRVYSYFTSGPAYDTVSSVTSIDPATGSQRVTSYSYTTDFNGRIASRTETQALPAGSASTTSAFDSLGMLQSVTNALGHVTSYSQYNGLGLPGRLTDANGVVTDYVYNPNGTLAYQVAYVNDGGRVLTYAYDHARNVTDIAHSSGRIERFRYKNFKRVEYIGNAQNEFVQLAYTAPTLSVTTSSPRNIPSTSGATPIALGDGQFSVATQLDSLGRTRQQSGNAGQQVSYTYDNNGNVKPAAMRPAAPPTTTTTPRIDRPR